MEAILDCRRRHNQTQYLIKWKGYGPEDNSWEPESNLHARELLQAFKDSHATKLAQLALRRGHCQRCYLVGRRCAPVRLERTFLCALVCALLLTLVGMFRLTLVRARVLVGTGRRAPVGAGVRASVRGCTCAFARRRAHVRGVWRQSPYLGLLHTLLGAA